MAAQNENVSWLLNLGICLFLKSAVIYYKINGDAVLCREDSKYQLTFILSAIKFQHDFVNLSLFSYINILK